MGEPERDAPGGGGRAPGGGTRARRRRTQLARRRRVDRADRVVELTDAGEPRRESDVRDGEFGGLEEDPRGVRPLGPGQRDRTGADLGRELPLDLAGAVAEPCGETGHALAVHHTVADQAHGATDDIGPYVPGRGARNRVRAATAAGPETRTLRGGGRRVEPHVAPLRRHRGAARPAVDPRGPHGEEELPVEPGVPAPHGLVPGVLVPGVLVVHPSSVARPERQSWRKSDTAPWPGEAPGPAANRARRQPRPHYQRPHYQRPRLASIAARPSAPLRFQSRRISARTRASVLATIRWFSRSSLR